MAMLFDPYKVVSVVHPSPHRCSRSGRSLTRVYLPSVPPLGVGAFYLQLMEFYDTTEDLQVCLKYYMVDRENAEGFEQGGVTGSGSAICGSDAPVVP